MMTLLVRDLKLAFRVGGGALTGVLFFLVVVTVVPFAIGPDLNLLAKIGPGNLVDISAAGQSFWALIGFFSRIERTARLIFWSFSPTQMTAAAVFIKCVAHWLANGPAL